MASLHPTHGARVVLEIESVGDGEARYRVAIHEPDAVTHQAKAQIGASGVELGPFEGAPPEWSVIFARRLLEGLPKKHAADGTWPRKVTRWRQER